MPFHAVLKWERHDAEGMPLLVASKWQKRNEEGHTPPRRVDDEMKTQWGGGMPLLTVLKWK